MKLAIRTGQNHFQLTLLAGSGSFCGARLASAEHSQIGHKVIVRQLDGFDERETKNVP